MTTPVHDHPHVHAADPAYDAPRTGAVERQYMSEMVTRFTKVKKLIRETIVDNDYFGLDKSRVVAMASSLKAPFEFTTTPQKINAFMEWLRGAQDAEILGVTERVGRTVVAQSAWQDVYVRRTYAKGVEWAEKKLAEKGISVTAEELRDVFARPIHADELGLLYTRNFTELEGINEAMDQVISRHLADGLAQGQGPREIARLLAKDVDNIGINRARTLARTEISRAQSVASLNRYTDYGVKKVELLVGPGPCLSGECDAMRGEYEIKDAQGIIPIHPNCKCAWSPVVGGER